MQRAAKTEYTLSVDLCICNLILQNYLLIQRRHSSEVREFEFVRNCFLFHNVQPITYKISNDLKLLFEKDLIPLRACSK